MNRFVLYGILLVIVPGFSTDAGAAEALHRTITASRILDLTHPMHEGMPYWPGGVPFSMERMVDYAQGYLLHRFEMGENTGTHVDAPSHFFQGKRAIDTIPLQDLVVPIAVIDVSGKTATNPDYRLSPDDILSWERQYGTLPRNSLVIMNTGWHRKFNSPQDYINQDENGIMHFPGYSAEAAELLIKRDVAGIGVDTLSIDYGASTDFAAHRIMLKHDKYQIENMANLDRLPPTGANAIIGVLPVRGGSQAQARIFALLP